MVFLACLGALTGPAQAASNMVKCVDANGKIEFSDRPCPPASSAAWAVRGGKQIRPAPAAPDQPRPAQVARTFAETKPVQAGAGKAPARQVVATVAPAVRQQGGGKLDVEALRRQEMIRIKGQMEQ